MYRCVRHVVSRAPIHLQPFQPLSPSSPAYLTSRGGKLKEQISKKKRRKKKTYPKLETLLYLKPLRHGVGVGNDGGDGHLLW